LVCVDGRCKPLKTCAGVKESCHATMSCCDGFDCVSGSCCALVDSPCDSDDTCCGSGVCDGGVCIHGAPHVTLPCGKWCGDVFDWKTLDQRAAENKGHTQSHLARFRRRDIRTCYEHMVHVHESGVCRPDLGTVPCMVNDQGRCVLRKPGG
jgi:hypothetical protein